MITSHILNQNKHAQQNIRHIQNLILIIIQDDFKLNADHLVLAIEKNVFWNTSEKHKNIYFILTIQCRQWAVSSKAKAAAPSTIRKTSSSKTNLTKNMHFAFAQRVSKIKRNDLKQSQKQP